MHRARLLSVCLALPILMAGVARAADHGNTVPNGGTTLSPRKLTVIVGDLVAGGIEELAADDGDSVVVFPAIELDGSDVYQTTSMRISFVAPPASIPRRVRLALAVEETPYSLELALEHAQTNALTPIAVGVHQLPLGANQIMRLTVDIPDADASRFVGPDGSIVLHATVRYLICPGCGDQGSDRDFDMASVEIDE